MKQWLPLMNTRNEDLVSYEVIYALDEGPGFQIVNKRNPISEDYVIEAKQLWVSADNSKALFSATPTLAFTAEESEDMTAVNVDIYTTVRTEISRFMMGEQELNDETWQAYVDKIEAMGLAELQEYYETAYARYQDR